MKLLRTTQSLLVVLAVCFANIGFAEHHHKIKHKVDEAAKSIKAGIDKLGEDRQAIQNYLDNYQWKGMIRGRAASGIVTLSDLKLNQHSRVAVVRPDSEIEAEVACSIDQDKVSPFEIYRVVVGLKGMGPQAVICNSLGLFSGTSIEKFTLKAPHAPGFYEIRFRTVNRALEVVAFDDWIDKRGDEPSASTTIGVILVKP
jgi:hypothetical protein